MVPCYSFSLLQKRQRTLVTVVIVCVLIVMVTTISWRVPALQARFLPADGRPSSPPDSKDALHIPAAVTEGSTIRPAADRYYENFHSPPLDSVTGIINNRFIHSVVICLILRFPLVFISQVSS